MVKQAFLLVFHIVFGIELIGQELITVSGYVEDGLSREKLIGAHIISHPSDNITATNRFGFFSVDIEKEGDFIFIVSYIGYKPDTINLKSDKNLNLTIRLAYNIENEEIIITDKRIKKKVNQEVNI